MFAFSIISQHSNGTGSAVLMGDMGQFVNTLATGDLAMQGAKASAAIVLI